MDLYGHPFATLSNDCLRLDYLTDLGPRIIGLYARGVEGNLFAVTPDSHWPTPHGEYYLYGGHRLWTAPENPFYTCPEEHVNILTTKDEVTLRGSVDASGLEKEISFHLEENRAALTHRITWHGDKPIELAPWSITQMRLGGMAILPQSGVDTGLQPNRSMVLWPYARLRDERLDLQDDWILVHGRPDHQALKIGNYNPFGRIAYALGNILFTKRFPAHPASRYPDMGCNVEAYVKDSCAELETLGVLTKLNPGDTIQFEEDWEVDLGEYPLTHETANKLSRQVC